MKEANLSEDSFPINKVIKDSIDSFDSYFSLLRNIKSLINISIGPTSNFLKYPKVRT